MIKAVIIGFSHMHVNEVALYMSEQADFELAAVADVPSGVEQIPALRYTPAWNLENVKQNYCSNIYDDYRVMLDEVKPDIAFILTENCQKPEVVEECAKRGVNVCIEKPIAVSYEEALKIEESVKKYGIKAVVNWPVVWREYVHRMKAALDAKLVGEPVKLRYINRQIIDKCLKQGFVTLQCLYKIIVSLNFIFRNQSIYSSLHLRFFV